jgi:TPR repeat protein
MYYLGDGISQDYKQAIFWYRKAAMQLDANAQYNLGYMYLDGEGVSQDVTVHG